MLVITLSQAYHKVLSLNDGLRVFPVNCCDREFWGDACDLAHIEVPSPNSALFRRSLVDVNVGDLTPHARVLWREPLVAAMAPDHDYAQSAGAISIRDLARVPFCHRSNCELDALGRARLKAARVKLDVRVRAEREELAFQWVRRGKGITLAPKSLVPSDLVSREVSGLDIERSIGLQWQENTPSHVVAALLMAIDLAMK